MNIFHSSANNNNMYESQYTDATYQVYFIYKSNYSRIFSKILYYLIFSKYINLKIEQIQTNQVVILHAKSLLILTLIAFGSAVQLVGFKNN